MLTYYNSYMAQPQTGHGKLTTGLRRASRHFDAAIAVPHRHRLTKLRRGVGLSTFKTTHLATSAARAPTCQF
jgi:hypothetical protein